MLFKATNLYLVLELIQTARNYCFSFLEKVKNIIIVRDMSRMGLSKVWYTNMWYQSSMMKFPRFGKYQELQSLVLGK